MSGLLQTNQPVVLTQIATPYTVSASDTGKVFLIGAMAQAQAINLPAVARGLHYRFQLTVAGTGFLVSIGLAAAANISGLLTIVGATPVIVTGRSTVNFVHAGAAGSIGDTIDLYCDGTNWSVLGYAGIAGGITSTA